MMLNKNTLAFIAIAALMDSSTVAAGKLRGSAQNTRQLQGDVRCPVETQTTGMACAQHVPAGMYGYICQYGPNLCECDTTTNDMVHTWTCTDKYAQFLLVKDDDGIGGRNEPIDPKPTQQPVQPPVQPPSQAPVQQPTAQPVFINPPVQQPVTSPTLNNGSTISVSSNNEGTVISIKNDQSCPVAKPNNGDSCSNNQWSSSGWVRCKYPALNGGLISCGCNANKVYQCREEYHNFFSF